MGRSKAIEKEGTPQSTKNITLVLRGPVKFTTTMIE